MVRKMLLWLVLIAVIGIASVLGTLALVRRASAGRLYSSAAEIPHRRVGLLLGCKNNSAMARHESTQKFYIGSGADDQVRLAEHQRGQTVSTRKRGPWVLVYQEQFATMAEARRRERQLKSWKVTSLNLGT